MGAGYCYRKLIPVAALLLTLMTIHVLIYCHTGLADANRHIAMETRSQAKYKRLIGVQKFGRRTLDTSLENETTYIVRHSNHKIYNTDNDVIGDRGYQNLSSVTEFIENASDENSTSAKSIRSEKDTLKNNDATRERLHFSYILNNKYRCQDPEEPAIYLLVLILSHPGNIFARNAIRDTWGSVARHYGSETPVRTIFLLGMSDQDNYTQVVHKESRLYRDIVQANFNDTYRNLTMKTLMGLYWAEEFCSNARFVLKTDDDTMVHIPALLDILKTQSLNGLILGSVNTNSRVLRHGRWEVSRGLYPARTFPPYCNGAAYVLSADVAWRICKESPRVPFVPLEDVYITGILPKTFGVTPLAHPSFGSWMSRLEHPCDMIKKRIVTAHSLSPESIYNIWDKTERRKRC